MTIAEFFVELGVKGSDKAINAFAGVKKGLGDMKSMSLEAKAALIATMYGLERMMSQSAKLGTGLTNFNALTGLSAKTLQQWQYAARQAGVSSDEFTGSLKSVQQNMSNMLMGKGAPEGMGLLANKVGFDPKRARDTFYVMEQLQKFARSNVPQDLGNNVLKSFGLSEGTIAAMRRNSFRPDVFKRADVYSDRETKQLDRVNVAWSNLGNKIEMAFGRFTAKHGMQLVSDISKITTEVIKLADAFVKLATKLKFFEGIAKIFDGWSRIFSGVTKAVDTVTEDKGGVLAGSKKVADNVYKEFSSGGMKDFLYGAYLTAKDALGPKNPVPALPAGAGAGGQTSQINQNLYFNHDGKDAQRTSADVKKAVQQAYRQNGAVKGGY